MKLLPRISSGLRFEASRANFDSERSHWEREVSEWKSFSRRIFSGKKCFKIPRHPQCQTLERHF